MKRPKLGFQAWAVFAGLVGSQTLGAQPSGGYHDSWHGALGWGHMISGSPMMLLFWGALVLAVVLTAR